MSCSFFVAGIIQGSHTLEVIHNQDYRAFIKSLLKNRYPDAEIKCSIELYPDSLSYTPEQQRSAFFDLMYQTSQADILIVFLPQASMGSAIEMWESFRNQHTILVISPLTVNWVVRFLATEIIPDLSTFESFVNSGQLDQYVEQVRNKT